MRFHFLRSTCLAAAFLTATVAQALPARADGTSVPAPFEHYARQVAEVRYLTIDSQVLGEQRTIAISLPDSYGRQPTQRYPVLLLLDGPDQLAHTESLVRFLARGEKLPEMIIVAVANTQRGRDLTPPLPPGTSPAGRRGADSTAGGADAFLAFLGDELLPTVDQRYRTAPWRALLGHSYGGLFGAHALVQKPELFRAYLLASPSLWWGDGDARQRVVDAWPRLQALPGERWLFLTSGADEKTIESSVDQLEQALQRQPSPAQGGLQWARARLPLDDHGTTPHLTWLNGLRQVFAKWPYAMPDNPTPADYSTYRAHLKQRNERYGVDVGPSLFELTHFSVAHAKAGQAPQALAMACQLAQRWGNNRRAMGALSRIAGALPAPADTATSGPSAARTVDRLALASAAFSDSTPQAIERVRQRVASDGGVDDTSAACARAQADEAAAR